MENFVAILTNNIIFGFSYSFNGFSVCVNDDLILIKNNYRTWNRVKNISLKEIIHTISQIDEIIHDKTRLTILISLYLRKRLSFTYLKRVLQISDGSLFFHIKKLDKEGHVKINKRIVNQKPITEYTLTEKGKTAIKNYIKTLSELLDFLQEILEK